MKSFDYIERYNRRPIWVKVGLFPILLVVIIVHSTLGMVFSLPVLAVALPVLVIKDILKNRRFWQRLRGRGQVARWAEVSPQLTNGEGTLLVEITPKGPGWVWWIDRPRDEFDPEHLVPTWQAFEDRGWEVLDSSFEAVNRWTLERLEIYASTARALRPSRSQLTALGSEVKGRSVLAVYCVCEGCLSRRCN